MNTQMQPEWESLKSYLQDESEKAAAESNRYYGMNDNLAGRTYLDRMFAFQQVVAMMRHIEMSRQVAYDNDDILTYHDDGVVSVTTVELNGTPVAAPCAIEGRCQYQNNTAELHELQSEIAALRCDLRRSECEIDGLRASNDVLREERDSLAMDDWTSIESAPKIDPMNNGPWLLFAHLVPGINEWVYTVGWWRAARNQFEDSQQRPVHASHWTFINDPQ